MGNTNKRKFYIKKKAKPKCAPLKSGYKWVNFVWPEVEWKRIAAEAESQGIRPNDFVWWILKNSILAEIDEKNFNISMEALEREESK
jgi:hypothetical protein